MDVSSILGALVPQERSLVFSKLRTPDVAAAILAHLDHDLAQLPPQSLGKFVRQHLES